MDRFSNGLFGLLLHIEPSLSDRDDQGREPDRNCRCVIFSDLESTEELKLEKKSQLDYDHSWQLTITTIQDESKAACLFFGLQRLLRTRTSVIANHQFKSRIWRKRTFNLAALYRGSQGYQTDWCSMNEHSFVHSIDIIYIKSSEAQLQNILYHPNPYTNIWSRSVRLQPAIGESVLQRERRLSRIWSHTDRSSLSIVRERKMSF